MMFSMLYVTPSCTESYTLSLHDALPILLLIRPLLQTNRERTHVHHTIVIFIFLVSNIGGMLTPLGDPPLFLGYLQGVDRKSTRLNSSHLGISYAVFCLKKKNLSRPDSTS